MQGAGGWDRLEAGFSLYLEWFVFERVVIVGTGLLGASLGLALKEHGLAKRVIGVGRPGSASLETGMRSRGAIDEIGGDWGRF